ncbi:hypothetical protein [Asaia spathodeae]|uniref:Uncharacterized protein n=1 Tax=Asaia spathodeae TaxID=657016 RepID=A0ABX2P391_9PROT|nr:hypothetical protein [Asaia spathodeae]GBR21484.1 hypothetical protein AA105894_2804 [Asaia spathodeae NBRC 105894]
MPHPGSPHWCNITTDKPLPSEATDRHKTQEGAATWIMKRRRAYCLSGFLDQQGDTPRSRHGFSFLTQRNAEYSNRLLLWT